MTAELRDAIDLLRRQRAEAVALVQKYDHAIILLEQLDREREGQPAEPAGQTTGQIHGIDSTIKMGVPTVFAGRPRRSVKQRVLALLDEDVTRVWAVAEIAHEFELRGDSLEAKDVDNAVRTALSEGTKEGRVIRTGVGLYQAGMSGRQAATSQ